MDALKNTSRAFTLIELLVVIAIIGLLSSVVLASVNSARQKANVAKIVQDLKMIEKALYLFADDEGRTTWWNCNGGCTIDGHSFGNDPTIGSLVQYTGLSDFLSAAPIPPIGGAYRYDYDGDDFCAGGCWTSQAFNILYYPSAGMSSVYGPLVDAYIDKGDGTCAGKISWSNDWIGYHISCTGKF
jgi:prepilin-type N-terminal cleavage/methylation domain-containing protein